MGHKRGIWYLGFGIRGERERGQGSEVFGIWDLEFVGTGKLRKGEVGSGVDSENIVDCSEVGDAEKFCV